MSSASGLIVSEEDEVHEPDPDDAKDRKSVLINTAGYIIVTEFCERVAYYGFSGSLVLFFQVRHLSLLFLSVQQLIDHFHLIIDSFKYVKR